MDGEREKSALEKTRKVFEEIAEEHGLLDREVSVLVKTISPEEAIGTPGRRDFPIVIGRERVIEADFMGTKAHAFTDSPREFVGTLREIVDMPLDTNGRRATYIAVLNAVLRHVNIIEATLHCRDDEPEECAKEVSRLIKERHGNIRIGLIGLNPAIAERLSNDFGKENMRITDLARANIGEKKFGVEIWDGTVMTEELVKASDLVILTGTTLVNDTFDVIWKLIQQYRKEYLIFGVTAAGICKLEDMNRVCPYGRK